MVNNADIFFDKNRIRVLEDLDVSPSGDGDATVELDPGKSSITVRSRGSDAPATINLSNAQGDETPVTLTEDNAAAGFLEVTDGPTGPTVRFDARSDRDTPLPDPEVELAEAGSRKASVKPGRINLLFKEDFPGLAAKGSGVLTLTNRQAKSAGGRESCKLDGSQSALVVSTTPELPQGDDVGTPQPGGGELVLQSETDGIPDVQIHFQGEKDKQTDYGVGNQNRPRIHFDGPDAKLDLGRHRLGDDRPSKQGAATVRSENGDDVLDARIRWESEIVFKYSDGFGPSEHRGKISAHPEGIMVYDAGGHEALLFKDSGALETRKEVTANATL